MDVLITTILHDVKRIAELERQMNAALDKVCHDILAYEKQKIEGVSHGLDPALASK